MKDATFGLSFEPPCILWFPKKLSRGSWHNFSLKKNLTPGVLVNMYSINSQNDFTMNTHTKNVDPISVQKNSTCKPQAIQSFPAQTKSVLF